MSYNGVFTYNGIFMHIFESLMCDLEWTELGNNKLVKLQTIYYL